MTQTLGPIFSGESSQLMSLKYKHFSSDLSYEVIALCCNYGWEISRGMVSRQKSGRVGSRSRSGWPIPTLRQIGIRSRSLSSNFQDKIGENWDFPWLFPMLLGQFRQGTGNIETIPTFPDFSSGSGCSLKTDPDCLSGSGWFLNPDLDFGLRLRWPPRFISPIVDVLSPVTAT